MSGRGRSGSLLVQKHRQDAAPVVSVSVLEFRFSRLLLAKRVYTEIEKV